MRNEKLLDQLKFYQSVYPQPEPVLEATIQELELCYRTMENMEKLIESLEKERA